MKDSALFRMGWRGERVVQSLLCHDGWYGIATADFSGREQNRAPMAYGCDKQIVLADIDASKPNVCRMHIEVKTKTKPNQRFREKCLEHGIDQDSYGHYQALEIAMQSPVVLVVVECDSGCVLGQTLRTLDEGRPSDNPRYKMINWRRDKFRLLWQVDPEKLNRFVYDRKNQPRPLSDVRHRDLTKLHRFLEPRQRQLHLLHLDVLANCEILRQRPN